LRVQDHLGHLASFGPETFVVLLPDVSDERLADLLSDWKASTTERVTQLFGPGILVSATSCDYVNREFRGAFRAVFVANTLRGARQP
jgi:hypothetical protein